MVDYYILSNRNNRFSPSQGCLIEFEDVLVNCCNGVLIAPKFVPTSSRLKRCFEQFINPNQIDIQPNKHNTNKHVLILVCLTIWDCSILQYIPYWRKKFDIVCAYVFDAVLPDSGKPENFLSSSFRSLISDLDYLFIPVTGSLEAFREKFNVPVEMIPMACDVMKFGSYQTDRCIDIIGYGRQLTKHSKILAKTYNSPNCKRIYYYTNHMKISKIHNFYGHRKLFWKLLHNSYIALAYDVLTTPSNKFSFSFVGQRWFECLAAGCLVVGRRPVCPEANQLLNWEDATIEIPDDKDSVIPFIESLLTDEQRLQSAHYRNYINTLVHHDWRYRIADMLKCLNIDQPTPLRHDLNKLRQQYETFKFFL